VANIINDGRNDVSRPTRDMHATWCDVKWWKTTYLPHHVA